MAATDLVGASNWNSAHNQVLALGGNTAGVSSVSGSNIVLAGGNNVTLSASQDANAATVSIVGGGGGSITISAGTSSAALNSLVYGNAPGTNVFFGLNGSTITANAQIRSFAGTTNFALSVASLANSNGVSFGLSTTAGNAGVITASFAANISAGTTSNNLSAVTFSNSNGVSFGLDGSVITGSVNPGAGNTISYFDNFTGVTNTINSNSWYAFNQSSSYIQPFNLPNALSASYARVLATLEIGQGNTQATSANNSQSRGYSATFALGVYQQGTGASSQSLTLVGSTSVPWNQSSAIHMNANGSEYTLTQAISYFAAGNTIGTSTTIASTLSNFRFLASVLGSNLAGLRGFDIPFASSLPASNLWLAIGRWTTTGTTGAGNIPNNGLSVSAILAGALNSQFQVVGDTATASSNWARLAQGSFSSTTAGMPNALAMSAVSTSASQPNFFFQLARLA